MVKSFHIIAGLNFGGANMMLLKLLANMDRDRFSNAVIVLMDNGPLGDEISAFGIPVFSLGMPRGKMTLSGLLRLFKTLRAGRPDLIQGWMYHGNLAALVGGWALGYRAPVIWNIRHTVYQLSLEKRLTRFLIRLGARLSGSTHAIIYNARISIRQHQKLGYAAGKSVHIPNGFDTRAFLPDEEAPGKLREQLGIPAHALLIGTIGRYHPMKDHAAFIQAAGRLHGRYPEAHFLLVGPGVDGRDTELRALVHAHGLAENAHLWGEKNRIAGIMAGLDIFSLSSAWGEGFPNVVGEAMASGVPCVVTDVGDAGDIVGNTGIVVPPDDPESLARAWSQLIKEGGQKRKIRGQAARNRIKTLFGLPAIVEKYEKLYLDAVKSFG